MSRPSLIVGVLVTILAVPAYMAAGQAPAAPAQGGAPAAGGRAGGGGGRGGGVPARTDLATAQKMAAAAEAAARAAGSNVAIAVVDANGDLVYFHRMDGVTGQAVTSSQGKARVAILFGVPTGVVAQAGAAGTPLSLTLTPSGAAAQPLQIQQGGLPLIRAGQVIAGIGVGGASPAQDEVFAQAGIDAVK